MELLNYGHAPSGEITFLPRPTKQWRAGTGEGHDPSEGDADDGMLVSETKRGHRLTYHNVAFDRQNYQRPQANLT